MQREMRSRMAIDQIAALRGAPVYSMENEKLGTLDALYYDSMTHQPEWMAIKTGFLGMKRIFVPVEGADIHAHEGDQGLHVPYRKEQVKDSPSVDEVEEGTLSLETERSLYSHYGIQPSSEQSETQLLDEDLRSSGFTRTAGTAEQPSISRHEEELRVGKRETEHGRLRIYKWVETEPASTDVELRRESAYVEREAVNRPAPGAQLGEQQIDVPLHEEEPVVGTETIEKERLTVRPKTETRKERVRGEVKKERVNVEGDSETRDNLHDDEEHHEEHHRQERP